MNAKPHPEGSWFKQTQHEQKKHLTKCCDTVRGTVVRLPTSALRKPRSCSYIHVLHPGEIAKQGPQIAPPPPSLLVVSQNSLLVQCQLPFMLHHVMILTRRFSLETSGNSTGHRTTPHTRSTNPFLSTTGFGSRFRVFRE